MKLNQYLIAAILYAGCITVVHAQGVSDLVVYIECTQEGKPTMRGSGVLVSEKGHVLTAGHVVPEGYKCRGVQGNPTLPTRGLIKDPRSMQGIDAVMLRFTPDEEERFPSAKFCKLDDTLKGKPIKARGFHQMSHELSVRQGVISTIHPNDKGIIETDGLTAHGMSGDPVMLDDGSNLIGITAGAKFDIGTAHPIYFGVLAAEVIADTFRLVENTNCLKASEINSSEPVEIDELIKLAKQGVPEAQYRLGVMYLYQKKKMGLSKDKLDKEGLKWLEKSAAQGYIKAYSQLGWVYRKGYGVKQDFEKVLFWYQKAAEHGDAEAQSELAWMYKEGQGVTKNKAKAIEWFRKAALQGDNMAQEKLEYLLKQ